jgi:hypothetical protein
MQLWFSARQHGAKAGCSSQAGDSIGGTSMQHPSRVNAHNLRTQPWTFVCARRHAAFVAAFCLCSPPVFAGPTGSGDTSIYRCPGSPAIFTSDKRFAQSRRCINIDAATSVTAYPVRSFSHERAPSPAGTADKLASSSDIRTLMAYAPLRGESEPSRVVPAAVQSHRDDDRRRILQDELTAEQRKLASLNVALGQARTQDSSAEQERLAQATQRSQSNIAALSRELARAGR